MTSTTDKPTDKPYDIAAMIAEAEAALQGVTDGPWDADDRGEYIFAETPPFEICNTAGSIYNSAIIAANARFIAFARQGVPALIAALRQVMAERDAAQEAIVDAQKDAEGWARVAAHAEDRADIAEAAVTAARDKALEDAADPSILAALELTKRMVDEAFPKINWGASFFDANAIRLLNEAPIAVNAAIRAMKGTAQ